MYNILPGFNGSWRTSPMKKALQQDKRNNKIDEKQPPFNESPKNDNYSLLNGKETMLTI